MKVGEIWIAKTNEILTAIPTEFKGKEIDIFLNKKTYIYLAAKRPNDKWLVYILTDARRTYEEGIASIEKTGITIWRDEAWEVIQEAHNRDADFWFLDTDPQNDYLESSRKCIMLGDTIRLNFVPVHDKTAYVEKQ